MKKKILNSLSLVALSFFFNEIQVDLLFGRKKIDLPRISLVDDVVSTNATFLTNFWVIV